MKKITLLLTLLISSVCFAQVVLENFDGATAPTLGFANGPGSATIVPDPASGGTNGNVLEVVTGAASAPWQQAELTLQNDWMDLTTTKTVTVDVFSNTSFDMLARVSGGTGPDSATDASHMGTGWETLTFDFNIARDIPDVANGLYPRIFFFNLWDSTANGWVCGTANCSPVSTSYVDNITAMSAPAPATCNDGIQNQGETGIDCGGPCAPCNVPPATAAPTPPNRAPADVISLFSDAYTSIGVDTFDTPWCGATTTDVMIASNPTKLITGLGCEGVEFVANRFDATAFTHFHMDIFTSEDTTNKSFNVKWSNWNGGAAEANAIEFSVTNANMLPTPNPGTWISIDIPLTSFTSIVNADRNDFVQFVISSDIGTVYYDNLYLHKDTTAGLDDVNGAAFKVFPNPTQNNWTISGNSMIQNVTIVDLLGKEVTSINPGKLDVEIDANGLKSGMYFARIESENGVKTMKLIKE